MCNTKWKIDGKVIGGETLLSPYASVHGRTGAFDMTMPGHGLLFCKDLEHSGSILQSGGEKHILTANLWATRKQTSEQVLFVTFPSNKASEKVSDPRCFSKKLPIKTQTLHFQLTGWRVLCLKHTWALSIKLSSRMTKPYLPSWTITVPTLPLTSLPATIFKILHCEYVEEEAISNHIVCVNFFVPFEAKNLLINLALEKMTLRPDAPSCSHFTKSARVNRSCWPGRRTRQIVGIPKRLNLTWMWLYATMKIIPRWWILLRVNWATIHMCHSRWSLLKELFKVSNTCQVWVSPLVQ